MDEQEQPDWGTRVAGYVFALVCAAVPVAFGVMGWQRRWMSDDGFINLRVVRHLLGGHGPVFNVGERVEAFTSPLWIGVVSVGSLLSSHLEWVATIGGLLLSIAGVGFALLGGFFLHADDDETISEAAGRRWFFPAGALTYCAVPVAWDYQTAGLETGLTLAWLGGTFAVVCAFLRSTEAERTQPRLRLLAGFLAGLGPLVRPELGLYSVGWLATILIVDYRRDALRWRSFGQFVLAAGVLPIAYQLFRMGYFASLVPNTAHAKSAFGSYWTRGFYFAKGFYGSYLLALPLFLVAASWLEGVTRYIEDRRWERVLALLVPVLGSLLYTLYLVRLGGGFMHGRLLLPSFFGFCLPVMVVPLRDAGANSSPASTARRIGAAFAVLGWAAVCAVAFEPAPPSQYDITDEREFYTGKSGKAHPIKVEDYSDFVFYSSAKRLRQRAQKRCPAIMSGGDAPSETCERFADGEPRTGGQLAPSKPHYPLAEDIADRGIVFATHAANLGITGMVLGEHAHIVDSFGLADPIASRLELTERGRPGHEKNLHNAWYVGRMAAPMEPDDARVTAARRASRCGQLGTLLKGVRGPLSVGEFLKNIYRSVSLHDLAVPQSPLDAYYRSCGGDRPYETLVGGSGGMLHRWRCPLGWAVDAVRAYQSSSAPALSALQARCRPVDPGEGTPEVIRRLDGPRWGGDASEATELTCDTPDRFLRGLDVDVKGGLVRDLRPLCDETDTGQAACPPGEFMVGLTARTGTLVDAAGVICGQPQQTDNLETSD